MQRTAEGIHQNDAVACVGEIRAPIFVGKPRILRFTAPVSAFDTFSFLSCWYSAGSLVCCASAAVPSVVLAKAEPVKARRVILKVSDMVIVSVYVDLTLNYGFVRTDSIQTSANWRKVANGI